MSSTATEPRRAEPEQLAPPTPSKLRAKLRARAGGWLFAALTVLAVAGIIAFSYRQTRPESAKSNRPMAQARRGEFLVIVSCRGELVAGSSVLITAPTKVPDLRIISMAPQGNAVKPGEVILRFDDSSATRQLQEKEAELRQTQASLDQAIAEARINAQKDDLDLAEARHAVEKAKLEVSKAAIVSALQLEEFQLNLRLAEEKARVQEATNQLNRASGESKIASFRTQRDKQQAEVDLTKKRIEQMVVQAPSTGVVTYLMNYSQGWVNARPYKIGDNVAPGAAVAELPDLSTLQMKAKVEEMDRSKLALKQNTRIVLDPFPEKQFPGKLVRVSLLTEQNFEWPPSRNFRAFASFDQIDDRLRPGMNGRLDVVVDRLPDAISVPSKAIFTRNGKAIVLVPGEKGWKPVDIVVVARNPDEAAVKGITAGTSVALVDDLAKETKP